MLRNHHGETGFVVRLQKISHLIQCELAEILRRDTRDPRLQSIAISEVEVTPDISIAKIFFTIPDLAYLLATQDALKKAAGFMRSQLATRTKLRYVPKLFFYYDESILRGEKLSRLIDEVCPDDSKSD